MSIYSRQFSASITRRYENNKQILASNRRPLAQKDVLEWPDIIEKIRTELIEITIAFCIGYTFSCLSKKLAYNKTRAIKISVYTIIALLFTFINCAVLYIQPMINAFVCYFHFKEMFMPSEKEIGQEGYSRKSNNAVIYSILLCILFFILAVITRAYFSAIYHIRIGG